MNHNAEATSTEVPMKRISDASHKYSGISSAPDEHHDSDHGSNIHEDHQSLQAENDQQSLVTHTRTQNDGFRFTLWLSIQLFVTIVIVVLIAVTVKAYQKKGNMSTHQKHAFNTIVTALILFLGLSFFEGFKSLAKSSRGLVKAQHHPGWDTYSKQRIESLDSLISVFELGIHHSRKWVGFLCLIWILLNLLAQLAAALISLTYSTVDGTDWHGTYTTHGIASATNLTCYADRFNGQRGCVGDTIDVREQGLAHAYGQLSQAAECCPYTDISDVLNSTQNCKYYCNFTPYKQEFAYRFKEYNPDDFARAYPIFTNRTITASSGRCNNYSQPKSPKPHGNGFSFFEYQNDTYEGNITIPDALFTMNSTTYIYRGSLKPQEAITYACGPRCISMWAHKARGHGEAPKFFECPITVSEVHNATSDTQNVSDGIARLAAASLGLQGRPDNNGGWIQYQFFPFDSAWETHFHRPDEVGAFLAESALGSIAVMAETNPKLSVSGLVPHLGTRLTLHQNYFAVLLVGIAVTHLLLFVLTLWFHYQSR